MPSAKDNMHVYKYTKSKKIVKRFYIQKTRHMAKIKTTYVMFLCTKSKTVYVTHFFLDFLK